MGKTQRLSKSNIVYYFIMRYRWKRFAYSQDASKSLFVQLFCKNVPYMAQQIFHNWYYINSNQVEGDIAFCQPEETLLTKVLGHYLYPHEMGRHIVFLRCLSVRSSVCPSCFHVRSISFEPLVGFTNNFAQMSSMMRRCAVCMFDQGRFKVKVTI